MAFNADEYIDVIVGQIAGNFQELYDNVEKKKELENKKKEFRKTNKLDELPKLVEEIKEQEEEYRNIEPLTVGLFGEWGSGKTHLLKLTESKVNEIQLDQKKLKEADKTFPQITIPVLFNAWRFEKEEHLIIPLFQTMLAQIEAYEHLSTDDKVKQTLHKGKKQFELLLFSLKKGFKVPTDLKSTVASLLTGELSAVMEFIDTEKISKEFKKKSNEEFGQKEQLEALLSSNRIESVYMNIPQYIEKISINNKLSFVFLIDDLDRCLPENTLKMLESIKLFLDVPSCAFVLAIDDDVVERGVAYHYRDHITNIKVVGEERNKDMPITGSEYLEKIIQLPLRIPVISRKSSYKFLEEKYRETFENLLPKEEANNDIHDVIEFFSKVIPPKPRKLKRAATLFIVKVQLIKDLTRKENITLKPLLIAKITILELLTPKLLRFIQNNDYERIYNRLVQFSHLLKRDRLSREEVSFTLVDINRLLAKLNLKSSYSYQN
ncbi:MAG: Unknown protein [uncultured Sulfurovum sp.]|uniref:KAP NTPase domain-containing protein n=1 Tax=uncultured Sulfurovum sp. TaxID=269237 RepID=A0A6S6U9G7_9BACT|nr:MAG: Unknown protein [uncultured Sulfurovum sp.]